MSPGDILYLRQGIYPQANNSPNQNIRFDNEAGTAGSPIAYVSYPTEVATIGDGTCGIGFGQYSNPSAGHGFSHHITIAKLKFNNSVGGIGSGQNPVWNDFRFIANDIQHGHGNGWAGAIFFAHYYNIKVLGNYVNDMGYNKYDHTIYLNSSDSTGDSYNIEVAWNELTNQQGGSNIKCNPVESGATAATTDVFIHDNYIHDSPNEAIQLGSRLGNIQIWNNLIYHTGYSAGGYPGGLHTTISISNNPYTPMVKFFNNTLVDTASGASCLNFAGYGNMYLDNNIYSEPVSGRTFYIGTDFGGFLGTFVEVTNNLYNNFTAPGWETHSLMGSPSFMSNTDFHLHSGSIAIDAGANTSAVVSQDYDGNPRPRYKGFDIGAFEYTVFKPLILQ